MPQPVEHIPDRGDIAQAHVDDHEHRRMDPWSEGAGRGAVADAIAEQAAMASLPWARPRCDWQSGPQSLRDWENQVEIDTGRGSMSAATTKLGWQRRLDVASAPT